VPRRLKLGDRIRLTLGGPVFHVARVTRHKVCLEPEVASVSVEHYGRRFLVPLAGLEVSGRFAPVELLDTVAAGP
jgi:hypothetical protein